jgi:hypothetical protein
MSAEGENVRYHHDFLSNIDEVKSYTIDFILWKEKWDSYVNPSIELNWNCVKLEENSKNLIPTGKGIYALIIEPRISQFPSFGYLVYIGQTGYESNRDLRKRFTDYLREKNKKKRPKIYFLLNKWDDYIYFYYAEVDTNEVNLIELEQKLLDTFLPPYSDRGFSAEIGDMKKVAEK